MKVKLLIFLLFLTALTHAQGANLSIINKLAENLPAIFMPLNEDETYLKAYEQLINCVAKQSADKLTPTQLTDFNSQLEIYASELEQSIADIEKLMKFGPPKPSKILTKYVKQISPIVAECEAKYDVRVEF